MQIRYPSNLWFVGICLFLLAIRGGATPATVLEVRNWNEAESRGWQYRDERSRGYGGRIEASAESIRLVNRQEKGAKRTEVVYPQALALPEHFALTLRARFPKLGLEDDGTGDKGNFRLLVGGKTAQGSFGLGFLFMGDRYKLDRRYKVVRTDAAWHTWRFEVDTSRKTVALYRDGAYVCLHDGGSRQPEGIRLQALSRAAIPAEVEIAELTLEPLPAPVTASRVAPRPVQPAFGPGEWPLWKRDPQNTGLSPLKGAMQKPQIAWRHPVSTYTPLPVFLDMDGDGTKEALLSHGGNLTVYRLNGSVLWRQHLESATPYGAEDLDGDGRRELIITFGTPSQVRILDAKTGAIRYTCTRYPMAGVAAVRIAKLNPQLKGWQAVVWSPQHEIGFCLAFDKGVENTRMAWEFNWRVTNFSPAVLIADMDKDRVFDVVVNTYDRTFVFDGADGRKMMDLTWPSGRNYGITVAQDVDGDGYPDVVALTNYLREHIGVLKNEGGKKLRFLWDKFFEQNYPDDHLSLQTVNESVGDFDGDGKTEIAYSVFDDRTDSRWHTVLLDALTGQPKHEILDRYLVAAGTLLPGRPPVLMLSTPTDRANLNLNQVAVWSYREGKWQEQERLPNGTLSISHAPWDIPANAWSTVQVNTTVLRSFRGGGETGVFVLGADASGRPQMTFLIGSAEGRLIVRWQASPPSGEGILAVQEVVAGQPEPQLLTSGAGNSLRVVSRDGTRHGIIYFEVGFVTQPVVARLRPGEMPSILYMEGSGNLCCARNETPGTPPRLLWKRPATGFRPRMVPYLDIQGVPVIADLNSDGEREILVAQAPNRLVALNAVGEEVRSWTFPALPVQWMVGNFDGDDTPDLFVTWPSGAFVDMESGAFSGKDGKMLWQSHCGNGMPALYDFNGDGRDDVLLRDLFERRTLDTVTGRDLYPITMWAGYHVPVVLPLKGKGKPPGVVWVGGAYSLVSEGEIGQQSWWRPFRAMGPQAVADVDGDGRFEIGGVTAGQLYNWPVFYAVGGPDKEFLCYDALTGRVKWSYPLGGTAAGVTAADVDGDGKPEFLCSTANGRLLALRGSANATERVLWEVSFPAAIGPSIVCDVDGSGKMSILIGCADGNLYCVQ